MSKSILVIDAPKYCKECPCGSSTETMSFDDYCCCEVLNRQILEEVYALEKPDWCPLLDLPEKKPKVKYEGNGCFGINEAMKNSFNTGFNACIDEILKGTNDND